MIQAHGGFGNAHCIDCNAAVTVEAFKEAVFTDKVAHAQQIAISTRLTCLRFLPVPGGSLRFVVAQVVVAYASLTLCSLGRTCLKSKIWWLQHMHGARLTVLPPPDSHNTAAKTCKMTVTLSLPWAHRYKCTPLQACQSWPRN